MAILETVAIAGALPVITAVITTFTPLAVATWLVLAGMAKSFQWLSERKRTGQSIVVDELQALIKTLQEQIRGHATEMAATKTSHAIDMTEMRTAMEKLSARVEEISESRDKLLMQLTVARDHGDNLTHDCEEWARAYSTVAAYALPDVVAKIATPKARKKPWLEPT